VSYCDTTPLILGRWVKAGVGEMFVTILSQFFFCVGFTIYFACD